ncbi:hypothetical protein D3C78_1746560 [compost metagenome]
MAPILQGQLQGGGDAGGAHAVAQVTRDDDEGAVAAAFLQGTKLHGGCPESWANKFQV